ncbi:MAG: 3-dehydroquinate synthase [Bdellovibrionaceae bacterium]|nr:3-dehydroquinate synthase [Pseudobdellovibrionaceae bacterium]
MTNSIYTIKHKQKQTKVYYAELAKAVNLSKIIKTDKKNILLIYDKQLEGLRPFKKLKQQAALSYCLEAGEPLKKLSQFVHHFSALNKKYSNQVTRQTHIVSVGGGSVGDFVGFLASVWKRGLGLTHIPSTWLAAVDSAHGGKTALNIDFGKNQLGSFYCASQIVIIKNILQSSSLESAYGEIFKMAFLRKALFSKLKNTPYPSASLIWRLLPKLIQGKYFYIQKDPLETTGQRMYLNLGHTIAHILELQFSIPHGAAVILGLDFSLNWSLRKKLISKPIFQPYSEALKPLVKQWRKEVKTLSKTKAVKLLLQDKKINNKNSIHFVFFTSKGYAIKPTPLKSLITELQRANYIK